MSKPKPVKTMILAGFYVYTTPKGKSLVVEAVGRKKEMEINLTEQARLTLIQALKKEEE